jgi:Protein of unknown function (DUF1656)
MLGQVDILGVFIPALIPLMAIAYVVNLGIRTLLARTRFYRLVWHRSVFDLGMYVIVFSLVILLSPTFSS